MKSKIVLAGLILSFISLSAFASPAYPDREPGLTEQIWAEINYPEYAVKAGIEGFVLISFSVEEDGRINISDINYSEEVLGTYVRERLGNFRLQSSEIVSGQMYQMKFVFKIL